MWCEAGTTAGADDLVAFFTACYKTGRRDGVIDLVERMFYAGALHNRWAMLRGELISAWTTPVGHKFADDIFPIEDDRSACIAEFFLDGTLALIVRHQPEPMPWWIPTEDLKPVSRRMAN